MPRRRSTGRPPFLLDVGGALLRLSHRVPLIGVAAGEPFYIREALNVADPVELLTRPMNIYS